MNPLNQCTWMAGLLPIPGFRRAGRFFLLDMLDNWFMSLISWFCEGKGMAFMNIFQINMQKSIFSPLCIPKTLHPTVVYLTCVP